MVGNHGSHWEPACFSYVVSFTLVSGSYFFSYGTTADWGRKYNLRNKKNLRFASGKRCSCIPTWVICSAIWTKPRIGCQSASKIHEQCLKHWKERQWTWLVEVKRGLIPPPNRSGIVLTPFVPPLADKKTEITSSYTWSISLLSTWPSEGFIISRGVKACVKGLGLTSVSETPTIQPQSKVNTSQSPVFLPLTWRCCWQIEVSRGA